MARDQMRNLEAFKIGSSQVNEFEYQKNQGRMTEQLDQHPDEGATGTKQLTPAERVKQTMAAAHEKVEKKRKKAAAKAGPGGKATSAPANTAGRKAAAKKLATRGNSKSSRKRPTKK